MIAATHYFLFSVADMVGQRRHYLVRGERKEEGRGRRKYVRRKEEVRRKETRATKSRRVRGR